MMFKKIIILTGSELRHSFFRKAIALDEDIKVIFSICEGTEESLENRTAIFSDDSGKDVMEQHIRQRNLSEEEFFKHFVESEPDKSFPIFVPKKGVNDAQVIEKILSANPDIVVVYGASLLKGKLVDVYGSQNKILNLHLGLSPYYRGSGTNFWALVNNEPECVGATFMFLNAGIDTGDIIHQIRADVDENDTPHSIGNRLILRATEEYKKVIKTFDEIKPKKICANDGKLYLRKDYNAQAVITLYKNFQDGMISEYKNNIALRNAFYPIIQIDWRH